MNADLIHPTKDRTRLGLLLGTVFLVLLPHIDNLEPSVLGYVGLLLAWRGAALYGRAALPNRWLLLFLTFAGAGLVYFEYHRFYGREAGAALFTVGLGLKLMELKSARDVYLVFFLACFVAVTQFLFSQSLWMAAYTLTIVVLLVASLIGFNSPDSYALRQRLKLAAVMVGLSLPLMSVLFVFFPRVPGPLWKLPDDTPQAISGLSDTVEPGAISRLALSQEPAFRVEFDEAPPPANLRYWRGPVFWKTDGRRWTLPADFRSEPRMPAWSGSAIGYTITLEPHQQNWVLALDLPSHFPSDVRQTSEYLLIARNKIGERARFHLESHTAYNTGDLLPREAKLGLELPKPPAPRIKALVESWKSETSAPDDIVQRALRYFRDESFYYTLDPPPLGGDPVDTFLFETRRGFCEHYATAFVVLMRAAGIPARLVTGYQGGQWNNVGRFLEVKQADAHAWAEVWLQNRGWTRIDPTAAVAPERIERGLDIDTQIAAGEIRFNLPAGMAKEGRSLFSEYWRQSREIWASIDHQWNLWVLSYGPENQSRLMAMLGIVDWRGLALGLGVGLAVFGAVAAWWIFPRRVSVRGDRCVRIYQRYCAKLAKRGLVRHPTEGPLAYANRASEAFPDAGHILAEITGLYLKIRYGRIPSQNDLNRLHKAVRTLKL
ncbi:DUF3488 and transglutaminase-like domain-containing protein [Methylococcus sp. EFPC2]|uniref:transglutaminase TgpA family protein n=1 Tax=Methylococcus sp. EFPC2 TaxID=2812648 RepID=UPI001966CFD2|nr:DUF3488 and transglutaminase-like domain-containing protein [Methylococcus sp. EFPC2]QSA96482.1 DUF3488 domain-containing transglutaminase family protein [Methylococcus sp. EFPC2]